MNKTAGIIIIAILLLTTIHIIGANEQDASAVQDLKAKYLNEKVTYEVQEEFDQRYPANIKHFKFYQGNTPITTEEFIKLSNDKILLENKEKVKRIKIAGFSTACVFGASTIAFLIPSIIFIVKQTNFDPVDWTYTFSGVGMVILTGLSLMAVLIDLIATFSLLYKHQYSEYTIRRAVENYNEKLRSRLGLLPDISYNTGDVKLEFSIKI